MTALEKPTREPQPSASPPNASDAEIDVAGLSILELFYHIYKEDRFPIIGTPDKVFAIFNEEREELLVFSKENKLVRLVPYQSEGLQMALDGAKNSGANFTILGEKVVCTIGADFGYGASYGEAALRAMLNSQLRERSCGHAEQAKSP